MHTVRAVKTFYSCSDISLHLRIQSNLSTMATLGTPKKRPLFRGGRYLEFSPIKLQLIWDVWGSGWPLLTGGRCSEVAVNTGLTELLFSKFNYENLIYFF